MTTSSKTQSPFAQSALSLDEDFSQLERLSAELERLAIDSDSGLDRAKLLLSRFAECGQRVGDGVQLLAKRLEESRARAEAAAHSVATRAAQIQERQQKVDQLLERFQALGEMARKVTAAVAQLQKPAKGELSNEERALLLQHLPEINTQLGVLVDEAVNLKNDAHAANMKTLEGNADSLAQSLQVARRRLNSAAESSMKSGEAGPNQLH